MIPRTRQVPQHEVVNVPADQVQPGMVTLYGVVLDVTSDATDDTPATVYSYTTPGDNILIAATDDTRGVTVLGRLHPQTLEQVRQLGGRDAANERLAAVLAQSAKKPRPARGDLARRGIVLRTEPDGDLYVIWSTSCDAPMWVGTGVELADVLGEEHIERLNRARTTGTSSTLGEGAWDDTGFVAEQVGWLPRARLHDYVLAYRTGGIELAKQYLDPLDDGGQNSDG